MFEPPFDSCGYLPGYENGGDGGERRPVRSEGDDLPNNRDFVWLRIESTITVAPIAERHRPKGLAVQPQGTYGEASPLCS